MVTGALGIRAMRSASPGGANFIFAGVTLLGDGSEDDRRGHASSSHRASSARVNNDEGGFGQAQSWPQAAGAWPCSGGALAGAVQCSAALFLTNDHYDTTQRYKI